jgi:butyryl-CoA dehydrogenase
MFQMMNEARIGVGMGAAAMATAAYYAALDYAQKRRQGRKPGDKDPTKPPVPIVEHADVKRMLLFQKACVEGALSLLLQCSKYVDMQMVSDQDEKEKYRLLLEILTPVAKTYPSENGLLAISNGLQTFGGSGYCDDYPLEQYYREARIHPIHEGTTGIHGLDLLGRKVMMNDGLAYRLYVAQVEEDIRRSEAFPELQAFSQKLEDALEKLKEVTSHLKSMAQEKGFEHFLADATLYLEFFGIITIAWQWLVQGTAVQKALQGDYKEADVKFYQGKLYAMRYFFAYELPKTIGMAERLMDEDFMTVEMNAHLFQD